MSSNIENLEEEAETTTKRYNEELNELKMS